MLFTPLALRAEQAHPFAFLIKTLFILYPFLSSPRSEVFALALLLLKTEEPKCGRLLRLFSLLVRVDGGLHLQKALKKGSDERLSLSIFSRLYIFSSSRPWWVVAIVACCGYANGRTVEQRWSGGCAAVQEIQSGRSGRSGGRAGGEVHL